MNIPKFSQKIQQSFSWKRLMFVWYRYYKLLFFFGFLGVLGMGGFFWYKHLYLYQWSEETKKAYVEQHFKETRFNEADFRDRVHHLNARARAHKENLEFSQDIFLGRPLK